MGNDGHTGGQVIGAVRQSAGDGHVDGLIGALYRCCDGLTDWCRWWMYGQTM